MCKKVRFRSIIESRIHHYSSILEEYTNSDMRHPAFKQYYHRDESRRDYNKDIRRTNDMYKRI